jgi:hypothetical protein
MNIQIDIDIVVQLPLLWEAIILKTAPQTVSQMLSSFLLFGGIDISHYLVIAEALLPCVIQMADLAFGIPSTFDDDSSSVPIRFLCLQIFVKMDIKNTLLFLKEIIFKKFTTFLFSLTFNYQQKFLIKNWEILHDV